LRRNSCSRSSGQALITSALVRLPNRAAATPNGMWVRSTSECASVSMANFTPASRLAVGHAGNRSPHGPRGLDEVRQDA